MHEYYASKRKKYKKALNRFLLPVAGECEAICHKPYKEIYREVWHYYDRRLLDRFPYIGGDGVSGTKNLVGAYFYVAMGCVLKRYGASVEEIGRIMVISYERVMKKIPKPLRFLMGRVYQSPGLLALIMPKKDAKNAANAAKNPGSFQTQTQNPPEEGYDFSYHNLVCPLSAFARQFGYEEFMPYLCNLDYVMFGSMNAPLYREHTCFMNGDYCDFKLKLGEKPLPYWPPVFTQDNPYQ